MKNKINKEKVNTIIFTISAIFLVSMLTMSIIILVQNIKLRRNNDYLESNLSEYTSLKIELDNLTEIKEKYNLIEINNQKLTEEKETLEAKIKELNANIKSLEEKIAKLK